MMSIAEVASILRRQLKSRGLTQAALRSAAGLSARTLTLLLSGGHDFKLSTLLAVADRLGLEMVLVPKGAAAGLGLPGEPQAAAVPSLIDLAQRGVAGSPAQAAPPGGRRASP